MTLDSEDRSILHASERASRYRPVEKERPNALIDPLDVSDGASSPKRGSHRRRRMAAEWGISFTVSTISGRFFFGGEAASGRRSPRDRAASTDSSPLLVDYIIRPGRPVVEAYMHVDLCQFLFFSAGADPAVHLDSFISPGCSCSMVLATPQRRHLT